MAKGKVKKGKNDRPKPNGRVTRSQRRAMERSLSNVGLEDLDTQLRNLGLCTKNITGDGNCLFRALSDQYYGQDSRHKEIRQEVCQFLRENEENYKFFVEDDQSFDHHVECMSQDATYGGNMELAAFAKMKEVDIKVYQPGMIYIINGKEGASEEEEEVQVLHIAYHSWEHYSSVRNIDGPVTGPPEIKINKSGIEDHREHEGNDKDDMDESLNSKEKQILRACPGANIRKIRRLLIKNKGDPNKVIDALYEDNTAPEDADEKNVNKEAPQTTENVEGVVKLEQEPSTPAHPADIPGDETEEIIDYNEMESKESIKVNAEAKVLKEDQSKIFEDEAISENTTEKAATTKPKKPSARERKIEQKRKQKEQQQLKAQQKAARKLQRIQQTESEDATAEVTSNTGASQSMKEMYI